MFEKCLEHYPFSIVEISPQDDDLITATACLLDETFSTSHHPKFTPPNLTRMVIDRSSTNCATIALIINSTVVSTVGWELRDYNLARQPSKLPTLSDGATAVPYRRIGFATLLNIVAFSRAIENNLCPVDGGQYLFAVTPSSPETLPRLLKAEIPLEEQLRRVAGAATIMALRRIKGVSDIELGPLFLSTHQPGHTYILMILHLVPLQVDFDKFSFWGKL